MIIVEGPDGSGKSTLVRELAKEFGLLEGERGTTDRKKLYTVTRPDTYQALGHAVGGTAPVRIWDRLFYSELVYAPLVDRPVEFSTSEQGYVRRMIDALACPIIVCLPPRDVVTQNVLATKDEQMDGVVAAARWIWNRYEDLWQDGVFGEHVMLYDYTSRLLTDRPLSFSSIDVIKENISDYLAERRERTCA